MKCYETKCILLGFLTFKNLQILCGSDTKSVDSNFKSWQNLYYQLFTIICVVQNLSIPVVFFFFLLLPSKLTVFYINEFQNLVGSCKKLPSTLF